MNYVIIFNGLGNQMSQYAFFLAKKKVDKNCRLLIIDNPQSHNGYELNRVFNIQNKEKLFDRLIRWIYIHLYSRIKLRKILGVLGFHVIYEPRNYNYTPEILERKSHGCILYCGGWHSEKYFKKFEDEVKKVFTFSEVYNDNDYGTILDIIRSDNNSVSLHIRRGDYLNIKPDDYWQFGGVATENYYEKCINYIQERIKEPNFYIFSNDIEWCKNNIKLENTTFINCNQGKDSWRDMQLMSECRHHILANSTFSWWGAWLSPHKTGITLHPYWFIRNIQTKDFYPERWTAIQ